eukprot:m.62810 g.62810  ORF g.62810 m.62810 type:complete len:58 (+) comp11416_c0_seq1:1691-1864(+)
MGRHRLCSRTCQWYENVVYWRMYILLLHIQTYIHMCTGVDTLVVDGGVGGASNIREE